MYGGSIVRKKRPNERARQAYEWRCHGDNARACIKTVLPFLREKAPQAMLVLQLASTKPGPERDALTRKLSGLKRVEFV